MKGFILIKGLFAGHLPDSAVNESDQSSSHESGRHNKENLSFEKQ